MSLARDIADLASVTARLDTVGASSGALSNRNVIINGAMQVAQRATSSTGIGASTGYFTCDRFQIAPSGSGRLTMTQESDGPSGFANCIKLACTTADTSIASTEKLILNQIIEGQNLQRFAKGTSDAKEFAVSFYVKGNAAATYTCELFDGDNARQISKTFSVTTSWTRVILTFPADTTGAFSDDNGISLYLQVFLHAGSDYTSGTLNSTSWASQTKANRASSSATSFFDSTDRTFFITGVQLEVGDTATDFEHRTFGQELALCQRYYSREEAAAGGAYKRYATGSWSNATGFELLVPLSTPMRTTPTLETTGTAANYAVYSANSVDALTALAITNDSDAGTNNRAVAVAVTTSGGGVAGEGGTLLSNNDTDNFLALDAEL